MLQALGWIFLVGVSSLLVCAMFALLGGVAFVAYKGVIHTYREIVKKKGWEWLK